MSSKVIEASSEKTEVIVWSGKFWQTFQCWFVHCRRKRQSMVLSGRVPDMFCHVRLRPEYCKYRWFPWCNLDPEQLPDVYQMNCLEFGDRSSPCAVNFVVIIMYYGRQPRSIICRCHCSRTWHFCRGSLHILCEWGRSSDLARGCHSPSWPKGVHLGTILKADRAVLEKSLEMEELSSGRALGIR